MARAKAYGPDTLQQTACDQLASIHLQTGGGPYIRQGQECAAAEVPTYRCDLGCFPRTLNAINLLQVKAPVEGKAVQ